MPATPAWPPRSTPRLFVSEPIQTGGVMTLSDPQAHYLRNVMRLQTGDPVKIFDGVSGEWLARVALAGKRLVTLNVEDQLRDVEITPDLWLLFAPIKKGRIEFLVEKACELGVARLCPVITRRTIVDKVNLDRLTAHLIESAEQCGRTAVPALDAPRSLEAMLRGWPDARPLYFADETGGERFAPAPGAAAILIGPEGGFDDHERALINALPAARAISLGPRILRAETAAIAAISAWMAMAGDWYAAT